MGIPLNNRPITRWSGAYNESWRGVIVPEAMMHPAKFARGLIRRIYQYLDERDVLTSGATILDPFGGVGLGAFDAMARGLRWIGMELEPHLVALGRQNLQFWGERYGFTGGTLFQGDSRFLTYHQDIQALISSPPYRGQREDGGMVPGHINEPGGIQFRSGAGYGQTPGQLGMMPQGSIDAVLSSPPYAKVVRDRRIGNAGFTQGATRGAHCFHEYGSTPGQLADMAITSPPYAQSLRGQSDAQTLDERSAKAGKSMGGGQLVYPRSYGESPGQLARMNADTTSQTFWDAAACVIGNVARLLPAGALALWVVKDYVADNVIVPFPDQWARACIAHGFALVEEIHASVIEDYGVQESLFGQSQAVTTERKSFFRRLNEQRGTPRIDHEVVLVTRQDGHRCEGPSVLITEANLFD